MKISIRLSLISRLVFFVSSPYPQALNLNNPPMGAYSKGGLICKIQLWGWVLIRKWGHN